MVIELAIGGTVAAIFFWKQGRLQSIWRKNTLRFAKSMLEDINKFLGYSKNNVTYALEEHELKPEYLVELRDSGQSIIYSGDTLYDYLEKMPILLTPEILGVIKLACVHSKMHVQYIYDQMSEEDLRIMVETIDGEISEVTAAITTIKRELKE